MKRSRKPTPTEKMPSADEVIAEHAAEDLLYLASMTYFLHGSRIQIVRQTMAANGHMYPTAERSNTHMHPIKVERADAYRFINALDATDLEAVTKLLAGMVLHPRSPSLVKAVAAVDEEWGKEFDAKHPRKERRQRVPRTFEKFIKSLDTEE